MASVEKDVIEWLVKAHGSDPFQAERNLTIWKVCFPERHMAHSVVQTDPDHH
jgi:hypothetical protein